MTNEEIHSYFIDNKYTYGFINGFVTGHHMLWAEDKAGKTLQKSFKGELTKEFIEEFIKELKNQ